MAFSQCVVFLLLFNLNSSQPPPPRPHTQMLFPFSTKINERKKEKTHTDTPQKVLHSRSWASTNHSGSLGSSSAVAEITESVSASESISIILSINVFDSLSLSIVLTVVDAVVAVPDDGLHDCATAVSLFAPIMHSLTK